MLTTSVKLKNSFENEVMYIKCLVWYNFPQYQKQCKKFVYINNQVKQYNNELGFVNLRYWFKLKTKKLHQEP